ncbi:hypothetical protein GUJ93_ZPchr0458g22823 [Zizania palustris]|uniref:Myb-like domain-containing protein n=1 Tax=Zizania palustris TaxID=103762 RepID=A0A8J5R0M0_ZIZPA|nr:hypothetical protein GUJ93_ZPchr0458g22823 [Zizania palustris]
MSASSDPSASAAAASSPLALIRANPHLTPPSPVPATGPAPPPPSPVSAPRDYRKGNWTLHETLILITAKRLDDDRRAGGGGGGGGVAGAGVAAVGSPPTPRSAEQRWKWVENYCWKNGCLRSQNQCNDKWDNLLRDYKKVRDYESRIAAAAASAAAAPPHAALPSYWTLERHERKDRNLPTNLAPEVHDALSEVDVYMLCGFVAEEEMSVSSESEEEDGSGGEPEAKRRRLNRLGSSVVRSATVVARTLVACEEKRERRHRELLQLEERRLRLEEERTEVRRQGFAGLVSAVNSLSSAIHALVSDHRSGDSSSDSPLRALGELCEKARSIIASHAAKRKQRRESSSSSGSQQGALESRLRPTHYAPRRGVPTSAAGGCPASPELQ